MDRLSEFKLGTGDEIKADRDCAAAQSFWALIMRTNAPAYKYSLRNAYFGNR